MLSFAPSVLFFSNYIKCICLFAEKTNWIRKLGRGVVVVFHIIAGNFHLKSGDIFNKLIKAIQANKNVSRGSLRVLIKAGRCFQSVTQFR